MAKKKKNKKSPAINRELLQQTYYVNIAYAMGKLSDKVERIKPHLQVNFEGSDNKVYQIQALQAVNKRLYEFKIRDGIYQYQLSIIREQINRKDE